MHNHCWRRIYESGSALMPLVPPLQTATVLTAMLVLVACVRPPLLPRNPALLPAHESLLQQAGWLEYVVNNIDEIRYYEWPAFQAGDEIAVGLAECIDGRRIAIIAIGKLSLEEQVTTIVHEAAHLQGVTETGHFFDEGHARKVERRFRRHLEQTISNRKHLDALSTATDQSGSWR